jgi:peptide/nickel transport system permease protein
MRGGGVLTWVGAALVAAMVLLAAIGPAVAPRDPTLPDPRHGLDAQANPSPPNPRFPLGADGQGRDVLSRLLHGARLSLLIGVAATAVSLGIATVVGVLAGFFGGWVEGALMRVTDVAMAFPALLLAVALAAVLRPSPGSVILVLGIVTWTAAARLLRGEALRLTRMEFVSAARVSGAGPLRLVWRHILPNVAPTLLVLASLTLASTILLDAGLSYLGLGLPPPTPSWGVMLFEGQSYYRAAPWTVFWPGLAVFLAVAGFNCLGHGLRAALSR